MEDVYGLQSLEYVLIKDKFSITLIEELSEDSVVFSKNNLKASYFQVRMKPEDVYRIAFKAYEDHYGSWSCPLTSPMQLYAFNY